MTPAEYGRRAAAQLPELTVEQRERLRVLLAPMRSTIADARERRAETGRRAS